MATLNTQADHDLQEAYEEERKKREQLELQNEQLRKALVELQTVSEQEEEMITNTLLKRITALQEEKKELIKKVEEEEDLIQNTLRKKLSRLEKEKIDMEMILEQEQENMVNRLQKQLDDLKATSVPKARVPSSDRKLSLGLEKRSSSSLSVNTDITPSPNVIELLRAENNSLKAKFTEQSSQIESWANSVFEQYAKLYHLAESQKLDLSSVPSSLPHIHIAESPVSSADSHYSRKVSQSSVTSVNSSMKRLTARTPLQ